jgi:hypothetical protein
MQHKPKTSAELRSFGLTVGGAFALFGALAWFWRGHPVVGQSLLGLGGVLGLLGLATPAVLAPVEKAWMGLAHAISKVTTPIFMGVVYFVVFTPAGLIRRTFGARVLEHEDGSGTAWKPVKASPSMERQF